MTVGFHFQRPRPGWREAVAKLPAGTPVVSVDDAHLPRDAKAANPGVFTIFRKEDSHNQTPANTLEGNMILARRYYDKFADGTWEEQRLWRFINGVKTWNEYVANSQSEDEKRRFILLCEAMHRVWYNEYAPRWDNPPDLVAVSAAIGNDIDHRFAEIVSEYGSYLSYHNYTLVNNGVIGGGLTDPGAPHMTPDQLEQRWYSGRWMHMDADYVRRGIRDIKWVFTEGGAFRDVLAGWRHPNVYNGNLQAYINGTIKRQLDTVAQWNATHNNRCMGGVLFTTGRTGQWDWYELDQELNTIADFVKNHRPVVVQPPPQPENPMPTINLTQHTIDYFRVGNGDLNQIEISIAQSDGKPINTVRIPVPPNANKLFLVYQKVTGGSATPTPFS